MTIFSTSLIILLAFYNRVSRPVIELAAATQRVADGDLTTAIRLLEQNWRPPKRPQPHHLRRAYALADLYDRAGRTPRARELFSWVAGHAPDLADVRARVKALS